jgi:hypothetical protein
MKNKYKYFFVATGLILSVCFFIPVSEGYDLGGTWVFFVENEQPASNSITWIKLIPEHSDNSIYSATFNRVTKTEDQYGNQRTQERTDYASGTLRLNGGIGILTLRHNEYNNREYRAELIIDSENMRGTCRSFRNGSLKDSTPCFFEKCDIAWAGRRWFCR